MAKAYFIFSKSKLLEQIKILENIGLKISYSYKTNREVGDILQELSPSVNFSIHAKDEIEMINDKLKVSFFTQAESVNELMEIINIGIKTFVVDNEIDLKRILKASEELNEKINISLRMKFQEHRIGTGKYFVYGMSSKKINEIIAEIKRIHSELKILVADLMKFNKQNIYLINHSRQFVNETMAAIISSPEKSILDKKV